MRDQDLVEVLLRDALSQSTCARGRTGAVLLDPDGAVAYTAGARPLATEPACVSHCGVLARCRHAVHAEMWCLRELQDRRAEPGGWALAVTSSPCYRCAQLIALSGLGSVLWLEPYRDDLAGLEILVRAGVSARRLSTEQVDDSSR